MMHGTTEPRQRIGPVIPPPPSQGSLRRTRRKKKREDRWPIWLASFALGAALGFGAYQWIGGVDFYFDYWLGLLS